MKISLTLITVFISSTLLLNSCKEKGHAEEFSYGVYENGKYINKFLGFTLEIPESWYVYNEDELKKVMGELERDESFNENGREIIKKGKVRSADLFMAQLNNPYTFDAIINPSFVINTERIDDVEPIQDAEDYMRLARRNMQAMVNEPVIFQEAARVELSGNEFDRHTIENVEYGYKYKTTQFCEIMNGYAVIFTLSYANEIDRKELVRCLSSLEYKD